MKKNYEILLFDLDGTLTDSKPGILNGVRYALEKQHLPIPDESVLNSFIGPPLLESYARHCSLTGDAAWQALLDYRVYYKERGEMENSVYEGIEDVLIALKNAGKRLLVCTSKPEETAERIIPYFGLDKYFEHICGATLDETRNTKPDVIRYALETCRIKVNEDTGHYDPAALERVVMVGDRKHDAEGAAEVGIDCIGVLYGYGSQEELENAGATYIVQKPDEVAGIILG